MNRKERSLQRNNLEIRKIKNTNRKFSSESDESSKGEESEISTQNKITENTFLKDQTLVSKNNKRKQKTLAEKKIMFTNIMKLKKFFLKKVLRKYQKNQNFLLPV